ncbi:8354_t:CDS:1, partial [Diversispora eburnea]
ITTDDLNTSSGTRLSTNAKQMSGGKYNEEETDDFDSINVIPLQEYSTASSSINKFNNSK